MEVLKFFLVRLMSMSFCCLHVLYSTDKYTEGERVLCVFASQNLFRKVLSFTSLELNFIKFVNAIEKIMNFSAKSKTGAKVCWLYPFIIYLTEVYECPSCCVENKRILLQFARVKYEKRTKQLILLKNYARITSNQLWLI